MPFPFAARLVSFSVSLQLKLGWLSEAEEINNQVERLKSPAPEAGATLLKSPADQHIAQGGAAARIDEWVHGGRTWSLKGL